MLHLSQRISATRRLSLVVLVFGFALKSFGFALKRLTVGSAIADDDTGCLQMISHPRSLFIFLSSPMPSRGCFLSSVSAATVLTTAVSFWAASASEAQSYRFGTAPPLFEDVILTPTLVSPDTTVRGLSGGPVESSELAGRPETNTGPCSGFMDTDPDHQITLTGFFDYLSLEIQSPEDTTLLVRGPGGSWCSDDVYGFNPAIAGQWFSGTYDVWVGSYRPGTYHPYVIRISEIPTEPINPSQPVVPPLDLAPVSPADPASDVRPAPVSPLPAVSPLDVAPVVPATPAADPFPDTPTN